MQSNPLELTLCGISLKNPVIAASGTFGFGHEYSEVMDVSRLGGISGKGLTLSGSAGNKGMRVYETPSGMLNSIGLENPGVTRFVEHEAAYMRALGPAVIANLGGHCEEDYLEGARQLNRADIDILELNISCPNVKEGGIAFGQDPKCAEQITKAVKKVAKQPVIMKLSPNVTDIAEMARAVEAGGADVVSLINTITGMKIDINKRTFALANKTGGMSGPAIKPVAVRMVYQVANAVKIPVIGMGGIMTAEDAVEFLLAGASAVAVGTANFVNPTAAQDIADGIDDYLVARNLTNVSQLVGQLKIK